MYSVKEREYIPPEWFANVKSGALSTGLIREGWKKRRGGKHPIFTKAGYGQILLRYGGKSPPNRLTAWYFKEAGVSRAEAARILGRDEES